MLVDNPLLPFPFPLFIHAQLNPGNPVDPLFAPPPPYSGAWYTGLDDPEVDVYAREVSGAANVKDLTAMFPPGTRSFGIGVSFAVWVDESGRVWSRGSNDRGCLGVGHVRPVVCACVRAIVCVSVFCGAFGSRIVT